MEEQYITIHTSTICDEAHFMFIAAALSLVQFPMHQQRLTMGRKLRQ
jgi:hypothetical protein